MPIVLRVNFFHIFPEEALDAKFKVDPNISSVHHVIEEGSVFLKVKPNIYQGFNRVLRIEI